MGMGIGSLSEMLDVAGVAIFADNFATDVARRSSGFGFFHKILQKKVVTVLNYPYYNINNEYYKSK